MESLVAIVAILASFATTLITLRSQRIGEDRRISEARRERETERWMLEKRRVYSEFVQEGHAWERSVTSFLPVLAQWTSGPLEWPAVSERDRADEARLKYRSTLAEIDIIAADAVRVAADLEATAINRAEWDLQVGRQYFERDDLETFRKIQQGANGMVLEALERMRYTREKMREDLAPGPSA